MDSVLASQSETFLIKETSSPNQISVTHTTPGSNFSFIGNVSGDSITSINGASIYTSGCSALYFSGTGGLNGVVLTFNGLAPVTCSGDSGTFTFQFLGTRQ